MQKVPVRKDLVPIALDIGQVQLLASTFFKIYELYLVREPVRQTS
jgi:hypothetical protein